ncbi:cytochrome c oxidase assembly protein Cox16p, mitochondrial [[Candida] railenensis]|uniref:Cytochrome c oxidase assembly protein COX16, mitochondrial n=1 Tax=[Candida] railenensis TaxID=45579 RepID=A0A9P0QRR1_9ASCO|nr:cytochrome c oxidase assembly protein Cox16p, mitochondrial [[Candida] railenensis]
MVKLSSNSFRGKKAQEAYDKTFAGKYQKLLKRNHFIFFGLPFMLSVVAGSIFLQKFTSVKYERHDEKYRQIGEKEMLGMIENKREVNKKDDYYRLQGLLKDHTDSVNNDDYEIVRVARKKEDEPVW